MVHLVISWMSFIIKKIISPRILLKKAAALFPHHQGNFVLCWYIYNRLQLTKRSNHVVLIPRESCAEMQCLISAKEAHTISLQAATKNNTLCRKWTDISVQMPNIRYYHYLILHKANVSATVKEQKLAELCKNTNSTCLIKLCRKCIDISLQKEPWMHIYLIVTWTLYGAP
jgi:hypothetical protein